MEKLFVYVSLGPGKPNEHILQKIGGFWKKGSVRGKLFHEGWGAEIGFPGIRLEDKTEVIKGDVFYSERLEEYWDELDEFEGKAYQRLKTTITLEGENEEVGAYIYALK